MATTGGRRVRSVVTVELLAPVHDGDWTLIMFFEDGRAVRRRDAQHEEMYNLDEDIGETTNLADSEPEKRAKSTE